jgi:hypothetical protein
MELNEKYVCLISSTILFVLLWIYVSSDHSGFGYSGLSGLINYTIIGLPVSIGAGVFVSAIAGKLINGKSELFDALFESGSEGHSDRAEGRYDPDLRTARPPPSDGGPPYSWGGHVDWGARSQGEATDNYNQRQREKERNE